MRMELEQSAQRENEIKQDKSECASIRALLCEYDDDDISMELKAFLDEHLLSCPECRHYLESLRKSWDALDMWPDIEPAPDFKEKFWSAVERQEKVVPLKPQAKTDIWNFKRLAASVAVLAIICGGAFVVGEQQRASSQDQVASSVSEPVEESAQKSVQPNQDMNKPFPSRNTSPQAMPVGYGVDQPDQLPQEQASSPCFLTEDLLDDAWQDANFENI